MNLRRLSVLLGVVTILSVPAAARAQTSSPSPFVLPEAKLKCRAGAHFAADSLSKEAVYWYQFVEGVEPNERTISVGYDSLSAPVQLIVQRSHGLSRETIEVEALGVTFRSGESAFGNRWTLRANSSALLASRDSTSQVKTSVLEPAELAQARALAKWLWERRCGERSR